MQSQGRIERGMIDWNRVYELRREIGADDFGEVVELFLDEVEEGIATLREGAPLDTLESHLHFLKGSALNLGFVRFAEMCQAGESAASQGVADQVNVTDVLDSYEASKAAFLNGLNKMTAA